MGSAASSTRVAYNYGYIAGKATNKWEQKRYPHLVLDGQECRAVKEGAKVRNKQIRKEEKDRTKLHEMQLKAEQKRCGQEVQAISKSSKAARAALTAAMVANEEINVAELLVKQAEWKQSIEIKEKQCQERIATLEANHAATIKEKEVQYKSMQETLNRLRISELKQAADAHTKEVETLKAEHAGAMAAKDQEHAAEMKAKEDAHVSSLTDHDQNQLTAHQERENAHAEAIGDAMRHTNKKAKEAHDEAMRLKTEHHDEIIRLKHLAHSAAIEQLKKEHEDKMMNYQIYSAARSSSFSAAAGEAAEENAGAGAGAESPTPKKGSEAAGNDPEEAVTPSVLVEEGKRVKLEPIPLPTATPDKPS